MLKAMARVKREVFVAREFRAAAYADFPLPIGEYQTISQPSLVALMTQELQVEQHHRVLEIGTGSGYQTAVLAELAAQVFTVEFRDSLARRAQKALRQRGYRNIFFLTGDGHHGWPEYAPYDRIMITAASPQLPEALVEQLKVSGRLVVPLGTDQQFLYRGQKTIAGLELDPLFPVSFVNMAEGEAPTSPSASPTKGERYAQPPQSTQSRPRTRSKLRARTP